MADNDNPMLFGTEKEYAWSAYQAAFDAGKLLPDHKDFEDWWTTFEGNSWKSIRELMEAAWSKGVQNRNVQGTAGFNSWWQEILAAQPKTT